MIHHDVVVIGGSLAGAACVRELARNGIDAIALERDRFPRPKVCGGFLSPGAVKALEYLGLVDELLRAGAVEVKSARIHSGGISVDLPFERSGLGISRSTLDNIVARGARIQQGCMVRQVKRESSGFRVDEIVCRVVVDASGKLGRFTQRKGTAEFGVQYSEPATKSSVLDFGFFEDGYGGGVSVEGGRSNYCFLVKKDALPQHLNRRECLVTGPIAYDRLPGQFIAIGDAAGMVDPFCGEGMRHALESGILAARVVAGGIRRSISYEAMKWEYESRWERQWLLKRALGAKFRQVQKLFGLGLKLAPAWLVNRMWD